MVRRHPSRRDQAAFTLVEIMIVAGLIGLLAALAIPSFVRVRKQSQGRRVVSDARVIDYAIELWAHEHRRKNGDAIDTESPNGISSYIKTRWATAPDGSPQYNDALGNPYVIGVIGNSQIRIHTVTRDALTGVGIDWGAY